MQEVQTFADAAGKVAQLTRDAITGLNALAAFQAPTEEECRAMVERGERAMAEQRAYEAERLWRNLGHLRYRSRRPLWYRLQHPVRGHQRPASLIHEMPDWYDY